MQIISTNVKIKIWQSLCSIHISSLDMKVLIVTVGLPFAPVAAVLLVMFSWACISGIYDSDRMYRDIKHANFVKKGRSSH